MNDYKHLQYILCLSVGSIDRSILYMYNLSKISTARQQQSIDFKYGGGGGGARFNLIAASYLLLCGRLLPAERSLRLLRFISTVTLIADVPVAPRGGFTVGLDAVA